MSLGCIIKCHFSSTASLRHSNQLCINYVIDSNLGLLSFSRNVRTLASLIEDMQVSVTVSFSKSWVKDVNLYKSRPIVCKQTIIEVGL